MTAEFNKMTISELDVNGKAVKSHTMHFDTNSQAVLLDTPEGQVNLLLQKVPSVIGIFLYSAMSKPRLIPS